MTIAEARQIERSFYSIDVPSEDDIFVFTEAMQFLINNTGNPVYMMELGGYYYGNRDFELALKYYNMAAECNYPDAWNCLGYVWYYGRTGTRDYEKAFKYFSLAKDSGDLIAAYKVADMYKNGYFVDKDYEKYKQIIEGLYPKVKNTNNLGDPLPEVFTRLAAIRREQGKVKEAVDLYLKSKDFLAQRISYDGFFGNLNIMMWLIDDLYKLIDFDSDNFDFFDLYFLLKEPCRVSFSYRHRDYIITASEENGEFSIEFEGNFFRNREEFFQKARIGEVRLCSINDSLYCFEVI